MSSRSHTLIDKYYLARFVRTIAAGLILSACLLAGCAAQTDYPPFWWTPDERVEEMLALAQVTENDVVYDLGSGDGRIVIAAAEKFGARGVGIEINQYLIDESNRNARAAGVADRSDDDTTWALVTVVSSSLRPRNSGRVAWV